MIYRSLNRHHGGPNKLASIYFLAHYYGNNVAVDIYDNSYYYYVQYLDTI